MKLVVFEKPAELLAALLLVQERLPELVYRTAAGWAVPLADDAPEARMLALASQCGWEMQLTSVKAPRATSIFHMLSGEWTYRDPLKRSPGHDALHDARRYEASYDLTDDQNEYINLLGARDESESQELLNLLIDSRPRKVEGTPILLEPTDGTCPFRFFWLVRWQRPDPLILRKAARAWWGPLAYGEPEIFLQWPFSLALPLPALQALPWGTEAAYVLLSREEPHYLLLHRREPDLVFRPLEEMARIVPGSATVVRARAVTPPERPTLEVRIQLVEEKFERKVVNRINEIEREIEAKKQICEQLRRRLVDTEPVLAVDEPLFLYGERPGARGEIPYDLRRLLVEWADQQEDLGSLYYVNLRAEQLPADRFLAGSAVHVVTTGTALGKADPGGVGLRLWEYAADALRLNLCPEWAEHQVKIFTPDPYHPEIYPDMRPGRVGARRLAEALLPGGTPDAAADWIALLIPDHAGSLHLIQLRIADFTPLCDAWQWNCRVSLELDQPALAAELSERTLAQTWESVRLAFQSSIEAEAQMRLDVLVSQIRHEISRLAQQVGQVQARIGGQRTQLAKLSQKETALDAVVADCRKTSSEIADALQALSQEVTPAASALGILQRLAESGKRIQENINKRHKEMASSNG